MSRKYTAQEMREVAKSLSSSEVSLLFDKRDIAAMLRQAADMMEREENREKKYEFSVNPPEENGVFQYRAGAELMAHMLRINGCVDGTIVRREVGDWEEVKE